MINITLNPGSIIFPAISIFRDRLVNLEWYQKKIGENLFIYCSHHTCEFIKENARFLAQKKYLFRFVVTLINKIIK